MIFTERGPPAVLVKTLSCSPSFLPMECDARGSPEVRDFVRVNIAHRIQFVVMMSQLIISFR